MVSTALFCLSIHEALMTVGQLFEHVFALSLQLFDSFAEDALFGLWEFLTLFYSFFTLKQINMNIVARSLPFIFIFYLSWNFIYVRWTGSSHSLDTLVFTVWFTQLIHVFDSTCVVRTSNMAASIFMVCLAQSSVSKNRSGYPWVWRFRLLDPCCTL